MGDAPSSPPPPSPPPRPTKLNLFGALSFIIVRVSYRNADGVWISPTLSLEELREQVYDTSEGAITLKKQTEACSYGKVRIEPYSGTVNGVRIIDGGCEVQADPDDPDNPIRATLSVLRSTFGGDLDGPIVSGAYVMVMYPRGMPGVPATPWAQGNVSLYPADYHERQGHQMHEVGHNYGLAHANMDGRPYGDITGYMGANAGDYLSCYSGSKSWRLGWYDDRVLEVEADAEVTVPMVGIADYSAAGIAPSDVVILKVNDPAAYAENYFVRFNRKSGINAQTQDAQDQVAIQRQYDHRSASEMVAKMDAGESYTIVWQSAPFNTTVHVCSIDLDAEPARAIVAVKRDDGSSISCDFSPPPPSPQPPRVPLNRPPSDSEPSSSGSDDDLSAGAIAAITCAGLTVLVTGISVAYALYRLDRRRHARKVEPDEEEVAVSPAYRYPRDTPQYPMPPADL